MTVRYSSGVPEMAGLYMDTVEVMGVSQASLVYIDGYQVDTFTFDAASQVQQARGI